MLKFDLFPPKKEPDDDRQISRNAIFYPFEYFKIFAGHMITAYRSFPLKAWSDEGMGGFFAVESTKVYPVLVPDVN